MMVSVKDLRAAKDLSMPDWGDLSPAEQERAHSLLGAMYRYYDDLATYTMVANGHIERLREALLLALADDPYWRIEARATLLACPSPSQVGEKP